MQILNTEKLNVLSQFFQLFQSHSKFTCSPEKNNLQKNRNNSVQNYGNQLKFSEEPVAASTLIIKLKGGWIMSQLKCFKWLLWQRVYDFPCRMPSALHDSTWMDDNSFLFQILILSTRHSNYSECWNIEWHVISWNMSKETET